MFKDAGGQEGTWCVQKTSHWSRWLAREVGKVEARGQAAGLHQPWSPQRLLLAFNGLSLLKLCYQKYHRLGSL